jgi:KaiC/GvpD/RAD55 family RecA-like ATPase
MTVATKRVDARRARFPHVFLDDASEARHSDYIIKGIVPAASNVLIYGPSGGGKKFFTIDLAAHSACGTPWRGHRVRAGLVVYIAAEAGESIARRFATWRDENLSEAREGRIPLVILTRGANLLNVAEVDDLMTELREISIETGMPLRVVVFDTLSRSIPGGDENSAEDMTRVVQCADRIRDELNASTVFVHHSGKDATKGARGHSALFAAADTVIGVADNVATVEKSRDGESGKTYGFTLRVVDLGADDDGDPMTTCVIEAADALPTARRARPLTPAGQVALQALREAIGDHGEVLAATSTIPNGVLAVRIDRWRAQFSIRYGEEKSSEAMDRAFRRGKEALLKLDSIRLSSPFVWLAS